MAQQWYYAKGAQQVGPVSAEDLQRLAQDGELQKEDLVWTEGMAEWAPAGSLANLTFAAPAAYAPTAEAYDTTPAAPAAADPYAQGAYGQPAYGQPVHDQTGYAQAGYAQPGYAQPGYPQPAAPLGYYTPRTHPHVQYAGFWWRFLAHFIDNLILQAIGFVTGLVIGFMAGAAGGDETVAGLIGFVVGMVINWLYEALQVSSPAQATVGKRVCSLRVTDLNGQRITFARATGRHFGKYLSGIILAIGYIMQAFTERRQALHDIMAGTLVLRDGQ